MMRGRHTVLATIATAGLLAACGGEAASVTTDDEARQAVVDTFRSSWNSEMRVDLDVTEAQIDAVLDTVREADGMDRGELQASRQVFDMMRGQAETARSLVARAEDGSFRFASSLEGELVFDVRLDISQLVAADSLTPEVSVLVLADMEAFLEQLRQSFDVTADLDPSMPSMAPELPDLAQMRAQASMFLPSGPVEDMVLAFIDGEYGGATGQMDLTAFGLTRQDLDDARDEFFEEFDDIPFDTDDLWTVVRDAITIRDFTPVEGGTRAAVDVHPRAVVVAIGELSEAAGEVDDFRQDFADDTGMSVDELPETVPGVATLVFDGAGHLRELTVPVLEIVRQVLEQVDEVPAEVDELMADLEGARYDAVLTLADVGEVGTVLDVDATTVSWQELVDILEQYGMTPGTSTSESSTIEVEPVT